MATIYGIKRGGKIQEICNQVKNMIRKARAVMEKDIAKDVKKIQTGSGNMLTQKEKQNPGYRSYYTNLEMK